MADVTQDQVVEYIKNISVMELSKLVKTLESELGVSAAAAAPVVVAAGGGAAAAAPAEEQTEFNVILLEAGANKINVIKAVREVTVARPEGSQGPRRRRAQGDQGRRDEGRGRGHQEEVRRSRREGRDQVTRSGLFASRVCPVDAPDPARSGPSGPRGFRRLCDFGSEDLVRRVVRGGT